MIGYTTQASWVLITAFTVSALDELFRSTTKAGTSKYDSTRRFLTQAVPGYAAAFALAVLVRTGWPWVTWTGLLVAVALIGSRSSTTAPSCCRTASPARSTGWRTSARHRPVVCRGRPAPGRAARQDADAVGDQVAFGPSPLRPRRGSPWSAVPEVAAVGSARMLRKGKWAETYA